MVEAGREADMVTAFGVRVRGSFRRVRAKGSRRAAQRSPVTACAAAPRAGAIQGFWRIWAAAGPLRLESVMKKTLLFFKVLFLSGAAAMVLTPAALSMAGTDMTPARGTGPRPAPPPRSRGTSHR